MSSSPVSAARRAPYRWAAGLVGGAGAVVVFDPERTHVPLCPFHAVTGLSCPLCGGLRSAYALLHGQLGAAVRDNVLLVAAVPLLLCWWVDWALRSRDGRPSRRPSRAVQMTVVVVALAFTVLRNLSFGAELRPV